MTIKRETSTQDTFDWDEKVVICYHLRYLITHKWHFYLFSYGEWTVLAPLSCQLTNFILFSGNYPEEDAKTRLRSPAKEKQTTTTMTESFDGYLGDRKTKKFI